MLEPALGDKVLVRARKGQKVQAFAEIFGRFMSDTDWSERLWDEWLHRRWLDGSVEAQPAPKDPVEPHHEPHVKPHKKEAKE